MRGGKRLKIAVFHFGFFYSGGGEKLVMEEVRGLRGLGHDVTCYAPYVDRMGCFPDYPEIAEIRRMLPHPPKWLPLSHAIWVLVCCLLIPLMAPFCRSYDLFMGANQPAPWFAFVLSRILKKPYVIYLAQPLRLIHPRKIDNENGLRIRDGDQRFVKLLTALTGPLIDWIDRKTVAGADAVLTNGDHVAEWIRDIYSVSSVVCPAGCHPAALGDLTYEGKRRRSVELRKFAVSKPYILVTNRHSPMKRFEYALWAMKRISTQFANVSLVITGQETDYTVQLKYLANGLGLENKVKFVGLVSEDELQLLYSQASLYVYTSPEEDFGMGIIEAMAAGTPVVAWDIAGPTVTVVDGETGFLVKPYDTEEFSDRIARLLQSPDLARHMGTLGHQRAMDQFSYESHNLKLEQVFMGAVAGAKLWSEEPKSEQVANAVRLGEVYQRIDK